MGKRTGKPRGRPPGAKSKHTKERSAAVALAAAKVAEALGPGVFEGDAHALLMTVYKDPDQPTAVRIQAATAAAPFEKPKLANIDQKVSGHLGYTAVPVSERDPIDALDAPVGPTNGRDPKASRH